MFVLSSLVRSSRMLFLAIVLICLSIPKLASATTGGNFGAGLEIGVPSGLTGKYWLSDRNALDFNLGFNAYDNWIGLGADYLWHEFDLIRVNSGRLPLYYGMGAWVSVSNSPSFGGRGVVGLEYIFPSAPLDAFLEIAPGISVLPETKPIVNASLGMRYFF